MINLEPREHERNGRLIQIVLTQPDETDLRSGIKRLSSCFKAIRRPVLFKRTIIGGYWRLHVTRNRVAEAWHAHLHLLVEANEGKTRTDVEKTFSELWPHGFHIAPVRNTTDDRERLTRYDMLGGFVNETDKEEDAALLSEYVEEMSGLREFDRFGKWRNVKNDPTRWMKLTAPENPVEAAPYIPTTVLD